MFSALKKIFGRSEAPGTTLTPPVTRAVPPPAPATPDTARAPVSASPRAVTPMPVATRPAPAAAAAPLATGERVAIPFQSIASSLPAEVTPLINPGTVGDLEFSIDRILDQLSRGSVTMPFSELRAAAPSGAFRGSPASGDVDVSLPLSQIVPRIDPTRLNRRAPVKRWDAPPEVGNMFGPKGQPLKAAAKFFDEPVTAPPTTAAPTSAPVVQAASAKPAPLPEPPPLRMPSTPIPTAPAAAPSSATANELAAPLAKLSEMWPPAVRAEIQAMNLAGLAVHLPVAQVEPALRAGRVSFTWQQIAGWLRPHPAAAAPETAATMLDLPLNVLAPLFVARFRARDQKRVRVGDDIPDVFGNTAAPAAPVAAPVVSVKPAAPPISAARPVPPPATLPLRVVEPDPIPLPVEPKLVTPVPEPAPIVVATVPEPAPIPMPTISLAKPPETTPAPATIALPAPAPAPSAPLRVGSTAPAASRLGALFGQPQKAKWEPAEIVQKVAGLPGVNGALIALPEGLPIAAHLPSNMNAEALAGFMPQMFARITQYTRELKLGDVTRLSLEVNGGHLTVFRAGQVYFGVLGQGTTAAPAAQLALIASELSNLNP